MKILAVIITKDYVEPRCMQSVVEQDYQNFAWMIYGQRPKYSDESYAFNLYKNCSETRNAARELALGSNADAFLFVDSDIVLPKDAVNRFVLQASNPNGANRIFGGWYIIRNDPRKRFTCGRWVADNVFCNYREEIIPSLVVTDTVGLGCAFIPRKALEQIEFEHGCDVSSKNELGEEILLGECGMFGNRADEKGFKMYIDGDVVCEHLERKGDQNA